MQRETISTSFPLGSKIPTFSLPAVDGRKVDDSYLKTGKAGLVIFTCNHCPYVKGSEAQLVEVIKRFETQGLRTVAISSNDAVQYPDDSFEKMKEKALTMKLPYPYLYDETQSVARAFDAACTPEIYLFDSTGTLKFHGTINDSPKDARLAKKEYLSTAIAQVLEGKAADPAFVHPIGCSIKWVTAN